jgi:hypothetical protein
MPYTKEQRQAYYQKNKAQLAESKLKYIRKLGYESPAAYIKGLRIKKRQEVFDLLGHKCVRCGFDDIRALQIDHINGDGRKEARAERHHISYYDRVIAEIKAGSKKYQILCANCNWIKRHENGEQF